MCSFRCEKEKKRRISMRLKERERKKNFEEQKQNEREYREALAKEAYEVWLQIKVLIPHQSTFC